MLKGLALTPPVIGRIAIGKVVIKDGKRLPEKDDEFTITTQVQRQGGWVLHPLDQQLRAKLAEGLKTDGDKEVAKKEAKLRAIPVRFLFDDPDLNLRANYSVFDRATGRPLCVGNGQTCKRATASGIQALPCPAPEGCELGAKSGCKPYGRLNVRIGDEDELGSFIFRTTGFNSIRTLSARLKYFQALSGGHLSTLALELRLRGKSTTRSHRTPIYYVDLTVRAGSSLTQTLEAGQALWRQREEAGFDQEALDQAARGGFAAGAFEESQEDGAAVVDEFYPDASTTAAPSGTRQAKQAPPPSLGERMDRLLSRSETPDAQPGG
ncbi:hypothetical protein [Pseudacidovorax sp. RU35E]|uniref:recombination directionality factor n=1 Tax=Pseudacidovorax sp. RU35E TaxID=1907403 RepID=UPI000954B64A|nr:hypothetical protein [Pseudacidovorax sp. RU35E]SIR75653.1 hypothetical protein SAMN05880557_1199 [Pseudacidovorax sp. RU35E]